MKETREKVRNIQKFKLQTFFSERGNEEQKINSIINDLKQTFLRILIDNFFH